MEKLPPQMAVIIPQDSYYKDNSELPLVERQKINFDHPSAIEWELLIEHIKMLKQGKPIEQPTYSYITCTRGEEVHKIVPHKVIIVEGIMILGNEDLRDMFDLKVFVSADDDDRLARLIKRDTIERGRDVATVLDRYDLTVKPSHIEFIEPTKKYANIIVPQGGNNIVAIDLLIKYILQNLK